MRRSRSRLHARHPIIRTGAQVCLMRTLKTQAPRLVHVQRRCTCAYKREGDRETRVSNLASGGSEWWRCTRAWTRGRDQETIVFNLGIRRPVPHIPVEGHQVPACLLHLLLVHVHQPHDTARKEVGQRIARPVLLLYVLRVYDPCFLLGISAGRRE